MHVHSWRAEKWGTFSPELEPNRVQAAAVSFLITITAWHELENVGSIKRLPYLIPVTFHYDFPSTGDTAHHITGFRVHPQSLLDYFLQPRSIFQSLINSETLFDILKWPNPSGHHALLFRYSSWTWIIFQKNYCKESCFIRVTFQNWKKYSASICSEINNIGIFTGIR